MKKPNPLILAIRYAVAWLLYWLGDAVERIFVRRGLFYPAYNRLMTWSLDVQGDGPGPWEMPSCHKTIG